MDARDVLMSIAAAGALFNGWQIARLTGRVDVLTELVVRRPADRGADD